MAQLPQANNMRYNLREDEEGVDNDEIVPQQIEESVEEMEDHTNDRNKVRSESVGSSMYGQEEDAYSEIVGENDQAVRASQSHNQNKSKDASHEQAKEDENGNFGFQSNVQSYKSASFGNDPINQHNFKKDLIVRDSHHFQKDEEIDAGSDIQDENNQDYQMDQQEIEEHEEYSDPNQEDDYQIEEDTNNFTAINQLLQDEQISAVDEGIHQVDQQSSADDENEQRDHVNITEQIEQENQYLNEQQIAQLNPIKRNQESFQKENDYLNGGFEDMDHTLHPAADTTYRINNAHTDTDFRYQDGSSNSLNKNRQLVQPQQNERQTHGFYGSQDIGSAAAHSENKPRSPNKEAGPSKLQQIKQLSSEKYNQILRKAMVLDKADRRKKDIELQEEIAELKRMRNYDIAQIKLLKVELLKLQSVSKKYQDSGAMKRNADQINQIQLPERYLRYLSNKKNLKLFDNQSAYLQQYGVTDSYGGSSMPDPEIHFIDQNKEEAIIGGGQSSSAAGIINVQNLLDDMFFLKNQIQCQLIRQKAIAPKVYEQNQRLNLQQKKQGRTLNQKYGPPPLSHQQYSNNAPPAGDVQNYMKQSVYQLKQQCRQYEDEINKIQQKIDIKKRKGRTTLTHEEKVSQELKRSYNILKQMKKEFKRNQSQIGTGITQAQHYLLQCDKLIEDIQYTLHIQPKNAVNKDVLGQSPQGSGRGTSSSVNFSNRAESDANLKHDRERERRPMQEQKFAISATNGGGEETQQINQIEQASKVVHDQTITILAPSQDDQMDEEEEDPDDQDDGDDRELHRNLLSQVQNEAAQQLLDDQNDENQSGDSLSMRANRLLLDDQSSSIQENQLQLVDTAESRERQFSMEAEKEPEDDDADADGTDGAQQVASHQITEMHPGEDQDEELNVMKQKLADLQLELSMSPSKFEDKLLAKLRQEIENSKQQLEEQMIQEMKEEQARIIKMNQRQQRYLQQKNKLQTGLSFQSSQYRQRGGAGLANLKRNQNQMYQA